MSTYDQKALLIGIATALAMIIGAFLMIAGPSDEEFTQRQYCQMVAMYRIDPDRGWPDYKETYDRECDNGEPRLKPARNP